MSSGSRQNLNCKRRWMVLSLQLPIRRYLPHILVGLSITLIVVGAYATTVSLASGTAPKALWSTNPLTISFSGNDGAGSSGSVGDSFKCAPPVAGPVDLHPSVSDPAKISLTTAPSSFASCGPQFASVTITARCLVSASDCEGSYTGTITIFQGYTTFSPKLEVTISVN